MKNTDSGLFLAKPSRWLWRIFLAYLATSVAMILVIGLVAKSIEPERHLPRQWEKNLTHYLTLLDSQMGEHPSGQAVESLFETYGVIRYGLHETGPAQEAALGILARLQLAAPREQQLEEQLNDRRHSRRENLQIGRLPGFFFARIQREGAWSPVVYLLVSPGFPMMLAQPLILLSGFLLLILALSFLSLYWLMRPLRAILAGLENLAKGNLDFRIEEKRPRFVAAIAKVFNNVASRIEEMVRGREQLLRDVSHDLRSPLTRMNVAVEMLSEQPLKISLKDDLQRMNRLIHSVLETYRWQGEGPLAPEKGKISLGEFLRSFHERFDPAAIQLGSVSDLSILTNEETLERILINLCDNAIKYAGGGQLSSSVERDQILIQVRDSGPGIPLDQHERIFQPFYRGDASRNPEAGFGLGLAISRSMARKLGGDLEVEDNPTGGAVFTLRLPR